MHCEQSRAGWMTRYDDIYKTYQLRFVSEIALMQVGFVGFQLVHTTAPRSEGANNRLSASEKIQRKLQTEAVSHAGNQNRFVVHQLRNSARFSALVLKQPPSALVLVLEPLSITPRDFTQ